MTGLSQIFHFNAPRAGFIGSETEVTVVDSLGRPHNALPILKSIAGIANLHHWPTNGELLSPAAYASITNAFDTAGIKQELFASQVEIVCGPHPSLSAIHREVRARRSRVAQLARRHGGVPIYSGLPPGRVDDVIVFPTERYANIKLSVEQLYLGLSSGLHVHKGITSIEEGIYVLNFCRQFIPALISLSTNSTIYFGQPVSPECCSKRFVQHSIFVTDIIPPWIPSPEFLWKYMVRNGWHQDPRRCWWSIRLNPVGTVEIRAFDGQDSINEEMMLITIASALMDCARAAYQSGQRLTPPKRDDRYDLYRGALHAAVYGLGVQKNRNETLRMLETIESFVPYDGRRWWTCAKQRAQQGISGAVFQRDLWRKAGGSIRRYVNLLADAGKREMNG